jgi:hypothetical protein
LTEVELVGVNDGMLVVIWTQNYLTVQGFEVNDNIVFQDNQCSILLEKDGKASTGHGTCHLDICYFFVTD